MELHSLTLPGCFEIQPRVLADDRGRFIKVFNRDLFAERGLATNFVEDYYSVSRPGVLRGMHFQTPPHDHAKLVYCSDGSVMDVLVDLRVGSPAYGKHAILRLSAEIGNLAYIAPGVAHGFYVDQSAATLVYKVTSGYAPQHDSGILWSSLEIPWPNLQPLLSSRDLGFPPFANFQSPFRFDEGSHA